MVELEAIDGLEALVIMLSSSPPHGEVGRGPPLHRCCQERGVTEDVEDIL